jgi:hypothetical protein
MAAESKFSIQGQEWVKNTMHCLQVALVPKGTSEEGITCNTLSDMAFGTHATCYVVNGLCYLPPTDWAEIVTVVGWTTLLESWDAIVSTLQAVEACEALGAFILF